MIAVLLHWAIGIVLWCLIGPWLFIGMARYVMWIVERFGMKKDKSE